MHKSISGHRLARSVVSVRTIGGCVLPSTGLTSQPPFTNLRKTGAQRARHRRADRRAGGPGGGDVGERQRRRQRPQQGRARNGATTSTDEKGGWLFCQRSGGRLCNGRMQFSASPTGKQLLIISIIISLGRSRRGDVDQAQAQARQRRRVRQRVERRRRLL